jgi:hypothetical protein
MKKKNTKPNKESLSNTHNGCLRKHIDLRKINMSAKDKLASWVVNCELSPLTTKSMHDESRMAGTVVSGGQARQALLLCLARYSAIYD